MKNHDSNISLVVLGYDFTNASAWWRSLLPFTKEQKQELYARLSNDLLADGMVFLDTCNRNELIVSSRSPQWLGELMRAHFIERLKKKSKNEQVPFPFIYMGEAAVRHVFRVSAGLESFVQGEQQISGQVNNAFRQARKMQHSDVTLNRLSTLAGKVARERHGLGVFKQSIRGVHDLTVRYLMKSFSKEQEHLVTVIGFGEIARMTIDSLHHHTQWKVEIANRSPKKSQNIFPLEQLPTLLSRADMAIVCTGAFSPVVDIALWKNISRSNKLYLVDLGIPAQVDEKLQQFDNIDIANLDLLMNSGVLELSNQENLRKVENLVEQITQQFMIFMQIKEMSPILQSAQDTHTELIHNVLPNILEKEFAELTDHTRSRLLFRLRGLIRDYTNSIIQSIHTKADSYEKK